MFSPTETRIERARRLRQEATPFERALWRLLRRHQMEGFHFRRQHPIDRFTADFACPAAKLVVELDGNSHDERVESDATRDAFLGERGWRVMRIANRDLMRSPEAVWENIEAALRVRIEAASN